MTERIHENNYQSGFLVSEEAMAGVSPDPLRDGRYSAYRLDVASGTYSHYLDDATLQRAIDFANQVLPEGEFESTRSCDGTRCEPGKCRGEGCKLFANPNTNSLNECKDSSGL